MQLLVCPTCGQLLEQHHRVEVGRYECPRCDGRHAIGAVYRPGNQDAPDQPPSSTPEDRVAIIGGGRDG